jgi:tellurite resistance protein TehA-like permease
MTKNWFLLIAWMFVAAISLVELTHNYFKEGFAGVKTWILSVIFLAAVFFVLRLRKIRNREKLKK